MKVVAALLFALTLAMMAAGVCFIWSGATTPGALVLIVTVIIAIGALRAAGILPPAQDPGDGQ